MSLLAILPVVLFVGRSVRPFVRVRCVEGRSASCEFIRSLTLPPLVLMHVRVHVAMGPCMYVQALMYRWVHQGVVLPVPYRSLLLCSVLSCLVCRGMAAHSRVWSVVALHGIVCMA